MNRLKAVKKRFILIAFSVVMIVVAVASAYVYETGQIEATQTVKNIATLTVGNNNLGYIEEGQTAIITKIENASLGGIVSVTTTKDDVYLYFSSDIDALATYYSGYQITVKYAAVGAGSTHTVGSEACTMTIASPTPSSITLDKLGTYTFDFELTMTAKSVSADQATTATITVSAQSS